MAFKQPTFNVQVNLWRSGGDYNNPPDATFKGNLSLGRRVSMPIQENDIFVFAGVMQWLLVPAGIPITPFITGLTGFDTLEIPAGSGLIYFPMTASYSGLGFQNQHTALEVIAADFNMTANLQPQISNQPIFPAQFPG